jgi:hypothetical protein
MRCLIAGVLWLTFILLVCSCSSKTIPQTDNQSTGTEVPQNIVIEEQIPTPEEQSDVDTPNETINTSTKHGLPPPVFPKEKEADPASLDYQLGYNDGYNDGCRGENFGNQTNNPTPMPEGWHSMNYKEGYYKGYSKGYAEWEAKQRAEYLRKKYSPR